VDEAIKNGQPKDNIGYKTQNEDNIGYKTLNEDKQTTHTTQNTKRMSSTNPTKTSGVNPGVGDG
jgi:hypothetical protein